MPGQLFTLYFLTDGIKTTVEWQESVKNPERFETFRSEISTRLESFTAFTEPNEAVTEQELIRPILDLLGWQDYLPQQSVSGGEDIPDNLLFEDADSKTRAASRTDPEARFHDALLVQESKRFGLPLDSATAATNPSAVHHTRRSCATCRPPIPFPRGASDSAFSPTVPTGVCTTNAPVHEPVAISRPIFAR